VICRQNDLSFASPRASVIGIPVSLRRSDESRLWEVDFEHACSWETASHYSPTSTTVTAIFTSNSAIAKHYDVAAEWFS